MTHKTLREVCELLGISADNCIGVQVNRAGGITATYTCPPYHTWTRRVVWLNSMRRFRDCTPTEVPA